jgi:hypothetical protein
MLSPSALSVPLTPWLELQILYLASLCTSGTCLSVRVAEAALDRLLTLCNNEVLMAVDCYQY